MSKLKIVTIVGTRPELIRLSRLIPKLDRFTDHVLVHTGQNSDPQLKDVFFGDLQLRAPDYYLDVDTSSLGRVMGDTLRKIEEVFVQEKPDAAVILGDTNSSVAAIVAERMKIPVYHLEAGNRSFDSNVPEEQNRKIADHVASFNLAYTEHARRNLLAEGLPPRNVFVTGSPLAEVFEFHTAGIASSDALIRLGLSVNEFFLVSIHRQENVDAPERLGKVLGCLRALREEFGLPIIVSTHPRTRRALSDLGQEVLSGINFHEPFGYLDYNALQLGAKCVVSDSGSISEESAIMGFRAVSLRDSIERPESIDSGSIMLTGLDPENLIRCVNLELETTTPLKSPAGYSDVDFSERVLRIILSTINKHRFWSGIRS